MTLGQLMKNIRIAIAPKGLAQTQHEARPGLRQRAIDPSEKIARREAIIDAAARLFSRAQQLPSVADVALEAGLGKGTMYLYFQTREAIYLSLHQRHASLFFAALNEQLAQSTPFSQDKMEAIVDQYMIGNLNFLPLCNFCMSVSVAQVDQATQENFHAQMAQWLLSSGAMLELKIPTLKTGDGVRFLHHGYALILGMYQLLGERAVPLEPTTVVQLKPRLPGIADFRSETLSALRAYWDHAVHQGLPAAN
jgi:AcrR family transcriptional regulator